MAVSGPPKCINLSSDFTSKRDTGSLMNPKDNLGCRSLSRSAGWRMDKNLNPYKKEEESPKIPRVGTCSIDLQVTVMRGSVLLLYQTYRSRITRLNETSATSKSSKKSLPIFKLSRVLSITHEYNLSPQRSENTP